MRRAAGDRRLHRRPHPPPSRARWIDGGVPSIEVGCVKDFPGTWAEYRVYEGGDHAGRPSHLDARPRWRGASGAATSTATSASTTRRTRSAPGDRCFTIELRPADVTTRSRVLASRARGAVPPFHAMAMEPAAERREAAGRRRAPPRGRPAGDAGAPRRGRRGGARDRSRAARLHERAGAAGAAAAHRRALPRVVRRRRRPRRGARRRRRVGRLHARVPRRFDAGDRVAVIEPGYPCYRNMLLALGVRAGADRRRPGAPLGADAGAARRAPGRSTGSSSPRRRTRPARCSAPRRSRELRRTARERAIRLVADEIYHGITYGRPGRRRRWSSTATRSSSTASPSTSR